MASSIPTIPPIDTPVIPNPFQKKTTKHVIQRDLIINSSIQGVQLFSLLSPIYALSKSIRTPSVSPSTLATTSTATSSVLAKAKYSRFSPTLFLRRVSIGTFLVGAGAGGTVGWLLDTVELGGADVIGRPGVGIRKGEVLIRDYSIIGGVIGALSATTIFLRRVPLPYTILGGAGLGVAGGVISGLLETYSIGEKVLEGKV